MTSASWSCKLMLVGEAWGRNEAILARRGGYGHSPALAGESGKLLFRMLGDAAPEVDPKLHAETCKAMYFGYDSEGVVIEHERQPWFALRDQWLALIGARYANVLDLQPPGNSLAAISLSKSELPHDYHKSVPPIAQHPKALYLQSEYLPQVPRLFAEISAIRPNLLVAMGNTAAWALLRSGSIGSIRGTISDSSPLRISALENQSAFGLPKVLPTYHPAGVLRKYDWRPIVIADLVKALRESQFPEIRRPHRWVLINPTIEEVEAWTAETLGGNYSHWLSADIETSNRTLKCISFARSPTDAIVIPFFTDAGHPGGSYWPTVKLEHRAWKCVSALLGSDIPKLGQNFLYDLQYLRKSPLDQAIRNCSEDLMLLHHSKFPELEKGLGFLSSIYTNEAAWKLMRRKRPDTEKRDE